MFIDPATVVGATGATCTYDLGMPVCHIEAASEIHYRQQRHMLGSGVRCVDGEEVQRGADKEKATVVHACMLLFAVSSVHKV